MTKPKQSKLTEMTEAQALERLAKVSKPVRYPPLTGKSAEMLFEFMAQAKAEGPRFTGFRKPPLPDWQSPAEEDEAE